MIDPLRFYDLETFLLEDVRERFHSSGSIGAFDFFSIVMWKANRAKTHIARKLLKLDPERQSGLEPIVRGLTSQLHRAPDSESRMRLLIDRWRFSLPMASAILAILWPDEFTVYDKRVCKQLGRFEKLANRTKFESVWPEYLNYRQAVHDSVPGDLSLRDKDRFLWAKSVVDQLQSDVDGAFA